MSNLKSLTDTGDTAPRRGHGVPETGLSATTTTDTGIAVLTLVDGVLPPSPIAAGEGLQVAVALHVVQHNQGGQAEEQTISN